MKLLFLASQASASVLFCYYDNTAQYRPNLGKFYPEDIDADLCTHVGKWLNLSSSILVKTCQNWSLRETVDSI